MQGMTVSEETMNWLLQRERSRNTRQMRKPILVERSKQKKSSGATYRTMKTFSIVTCGPNKVGFLPSQPILAPRPVPIAPNTSKNDSTKPSTATCVTTNVSQATTSQPSTLNIDDLLQLDMGVSKKTNSNMNSNMDPSNLLAQAAKQAGVAPSTPHKPKTVDPCTASSADSSAPQVHTKQPVHTNQPIPTKEPESAANTAENSEALDLLRDAFGDTPACEVNTTEPELAIPEQPNSTPVSESSSVSSPGCSITSVTTTSTIDPMLEFSWSNQSLLSETFPPMTDSLVDKLVHGDGDVVLSSLNTSQNKKSDKSLLIRDVDENSCGVKLSLSTDNFNIQMTPVKSSDLPIHPWTISTNSRESLGLSGLLNTPQKVLPSDSEDSMDGLLMKNNGSLAKKDFKLKNGGNHSSNSSDESKKCSSDSRQGSQDQHSISNFLSETDPEVDIQLQCMLNENSVDYISKFQDLVRQTTECDELSMIAADENARDGHISPLPASNDRELEIGQNQNKDNG